MTVRTTIARLAQQAWPALAVLLAVVALLGLALNPGAPSTVDVACGLVATLPLALARLYPLPVLVAVVGALVVGVAFGERTHDGLAVLALIPATYAVGRHAADRLAWAGLVVSVAGSGAGAGARSGDPRLRLRDRPDAVRVRAVGRRAGGAHPASSGRGAARTDGTARA
jgi:hypothetical protein